MKCLQTTAVDDAGQRKAVDSSKDSATVVRHKLHQRNIAAQGQQGKMRPKPLVAGQYYVIKVVDTAKLSESQQNEALQEII